MAADFTAGPGFNIKLLSESVHDLSALPKDDLVLAVEQLQEEAREDRSGTGERLGDIVVAGQETGRSSGPGHARDRDSGRGRVSPFTT